MLGIGRFGGILGAFSGAFLMQAQLSFETIFTLLAIPAFLSAFALLIKYRVSKSVPATTDEARSPESLTPYKPAPRAGLPLFFLSVYKNFRSHPHRVNNHSFLGYVPFGCRGRFDSLLANNHRRYHPLRHFLTYS